MWFETPAFLVDRFRQVNPGVELVSSDPVMDPLRMVKDADELRADDRGPARRRARHGPRARAAATRRHRPRDRDRGALRDDARRRRADEHADLRHLRDRDLHAPRPPSARAPLAARRARRRSTSPRRSRATARTSPGRSCSASPTSGSARSSTAYADDPGRGPRGHAPGADRRRPRRGRRRGRRSATASARTTSSTGSGTGSGLRFEETPASTIIPPHRNVPLREGMTMTIGHTVLAIPGLRRRRVTRTSTGSRPRARPLSTRTRSTRSSWRRVAAANRRAASPTRPAASLTRRRAHGPACRRSACQRSTSAADGTQYRLAW